MSEAIYECTLSKELQEKAREELNEKEEWRARDIQALRDMVKAHPGLHARMDDGFLLRFLRARKFDYDRAYQLLLNYYQVRAENKDTFQGLTPRDASNVLSTGLTGVLPNRDRHGRHVIIDRPGIWKPEEVNMFDILKGIVINLETIIREEPTQVNGVMIIADLSGFGYQQAKAFDRGFAKLMGSITQDAFPMRLKKIIIVNEPTVFDYVFSIFKPFMKAKLLSRFHMIGNDYTLLKEEIGVENLPQDLGGDLPPLDTLQKNWWKEVEGYESYHQEQAQYYLDLPHQIVKKPQSNEVVEGLVGSYKKLSVD